MKIHKTACKVLYLTYWENN